ncbi:MAG: RluA family pseudouridine synthase, partial [bacterium]|nr:RluA family pseudouridine synthase [bacterium]
EALVHGAVKDDGTIDEPVGRLPWNRERFGVFPLGKPAKTKYHVLANFSSHPGERRLKSANTEETYTLLELHPETGRTHQLRVHLKHIGHPIVSDPFYAGRKTARADQKWCPRLFLHAKSIEFKHPVTGEKLKFEATLPEDLQKVLDAIRD